jgi:RNA polymerase sigma-70 factor (ECF subfamily)
VIRGNDARDFATLVAEPVLFADVYERHGLAVRRYVTRRIGDGAGDDLAAEVFVRAFRARGRYRAEHESALPCVPAEE